jgi:hypothetical protein
MPKFEHLVVICRPDQIGEELDEHGQTHELIGMSVVTIGSGFGARNEAILAFRRPILDGNERQRRKPIAPITRQNNNLTQ